MIYLRIVLATLLFLSGKVSAQISYVNLGAQVLDEVLQGSRFYEELGGKKYVYTVIRGEPAHLLAYDLADNSLVTDLEIPGCSGAWDIEFSSDGTLYIASGNGGYLYSHVPKSNKVENRGRVLGTETAIWVLQADGAGNIYGGTYPGCRIFKYHPQTGFVDFSQGPLVASENYVRSLVYYKKTNKFYAGVGTKAHLIEFDPVTKAKINILPQGVTDKAEFVYHMGLVEGLPDGDRLFATATGYGKNLAYNLDSRVFEGEYREFSAKTVQKSSFNNEIYYSLGGKLFGHDITKPRGAMISIFNPRSNAIAAKVFSDGTYAALTSAGDVLLYNSSHCLKSESKLTVQGLPIKLNVLHKGPDNRMWTGGYLAGTNAAYNPANNESIVYKGLNQTESIGTLNNKIYFGTYTGSRFYVHDTSQPWDNINSPKYLGTVDGQDRPFGGIGIQEKNKVFFGTVPDYGKNGGVLVEIDGSSGNVSSFKPVPNQSVITLAYQDGKLFGGTSIWGGLGIQATETEAKLFVWDIDGKTKIAEITPVENAKAITCLINGNDGNIWGIAAGYLFKINPQTHTVISKNKIYNDTRSSHLWRPDHLILNPKNNRYYGIINAQLFRLSVDGLSAEMLGKTGQYLVLGPDNEMYYYNNAELWKMSID